MDVISIGGDPKKSDALIRLDIQTIAAQLRRIPTSIQVLFMAIILAGALYFLIFRTHIYDSDSSKIWALMNRTEKLQDQMDNIQKFLRSYNKVLNYLDLRIRLQELGMEFIQDQNEIVLRYLEQSNDKDDLPYLEALRDAIERSHRNEARVKAINKSLMTQDSVDVANTLNAIRAELIQLRSLQTLDTVK